MSSKRDPVLRHVHVHVPDIGLVRRWYVTNLGLEVVYEFGDKLTILGNAGDCQLGLEAGQAASPPERIHLIFRVQNVDERHERLRSRGDVEIVRAPEDEPYGHRVLILRDPVGHTVELYTPLPGYRPYD